jgi:VWFA-related protein
MTVLTHLDLARISNVFRSMNFNVSLAAERVFSVAVLLAFFACSYVAAQDDDKVIKVETDLAVFEVTVTDKSGKPVRGLAASDFRILEDGVERPVDFFQPIRKVEERRPLSVVFALDVSGSMTGDELQRLKNAMQVFIDRLADYDSYFSIVTFAMDVKTVQDFTNRPDKLRNAFAKLGRDQDGLSTHAYDAVDTSIRLLSKNAPKVIRQRFPKKAVVVISDGFPVGDIVSPETVIERANESESSVYSVILPSFSNVLGNKKPVITPLEASGLVERTGGRSFYAYDKNFELLFNDLADEITGSYAVAFYPMDESEGTNRNVKIESVKGFRIKQNRTTYKVGR